MQAFSEFIHKDASFWAFIKFISEVLGYTVQRQGIAKAYTVEELQSLCHEYNINTDFQTIQDAAMYSEMRAELLNNFVRPSLMTVETARAEFKKLFPIYEREHLYSTLPMNKQKGAMKQVNYFTAIINILTELTVREITGNCAETGFDCDPHGLTFIWDESSNIIGASSRRFDGAFPSINSPLIVWEIKEYYYATTFGSRVADGVYETQLDGFEFKELYDRTGRKVFHVLFVDAYRTWWEQGKPYLCRLIDALNMGLVDEVIVGREVLTRWPDLLHEIIK